MRLWLSFIALPHAKKRSYWKITPWKQGFSQTKVQHILSLLVYIINNLKVNVSHHEVHPFRVNFKCSACFSELTEVCHCHGSVIVEHLHLLSKSPIPVTVNPSMESPEFFILSPVQYSILLAIACFETWDGPCFLTPLLSSPSPTRPIILIPLQDLPPPTPPRHCS